MIDRARHNVKFAVSFSHLRSLETILSTLNTQGVSVSLEGKRSFCNDALSKFFDATSGMGWAIFLVLSIGHHVKFDARASKFLTPASESCLCEIPQCSFAHSQRICREPKIFESVGAVLCS